MNNFERFDCFFLKKANLDFENRKISKIWVSQIETSNFFNLFQFFNNRWKQSTDETRLVHYENIICWPNRQSLMDNLNLKSLKICAYPKVPLLDGLLGMNKSQNLMEIDEMLEDVHEVFSRLQKLSVGLTQVVDTSGRCCQTDRLASRSRLTS